MRRMSRTTVAGAAPASPALALSACGGTSAAANRVWAIGVDSDQYRQEALAAYKDSVLTPATKDVAEAVYHLAKSVEDGKSQTGIVRGDPKTGEVGLSDSHQEFKGNAELQKVVEEARKKIISGETKVKSS